MAKTAVRDPRQDYAAAALEELVANVRAGRVNIAVETMAVRTHADPFVRIPLYTELRIRYTELHRSNVCPIAGCNCEARHG